MISSGIAVTATFSVGAAMPETSAVSVCKNCGYPQTEPVKAVGGNACDNFEPDDLGPIIPESMRPPKGLNPDDLAPEFRAVWEWLDPEGYDALRILVQQFDALQADAAMDRENARAALARAEKAEAT